ncbi:hypothetical protein ACPA9J_08215 [Pseudomonas aeruginosa]
MSQIISARQLALLQRMLHPPAFGATLFRCSGLPADAWPHPAWHTGAPKRRCGRFSSARRKDDDG